MKKIIVLFDTHIPGHINLNPIFNFISDFIPDIIVLGGDLHDLGSVGTWLPDQSKHLDAGIVKGNFEELNNVLFRPLESVRPKKCEMVYLEGNHERRLIQAAASDPNLRGYIELEKNIDFKKHRMSLINMNIPYRIGSNLVVIHGIYTNIYHARKTVEAYHVSTIYGHVHTFQSHMLVSPVDNSKFYTGQSIGCLCELNPQFMKNRPNAWVNGFAYIYWNEDDDSFQLVPVVIVHGKFRANGKLYK